MSNLVGACYQQGFGRGCLMIQKVTKGLGRLLLDLARALQRSQKVCKIIIDLELSSKNVENNVSISGGNKKTADLNIEFDSNRLDPYQVGITILSSYTNYLVGDNG